MNEERLLEGAAFLDKIPDSKFQIDEWIADYAKKPFDGSFECGFAGCAMGWFGQAGMWGLSLNPSGVYVEPDFVIEGQLIEGLPAAQQIFDISYGTASKLFIGMNYNEPYVSPQMVADRIRKLVAQGETIFLLSL